IQGAQAVLLEKSVDTFAGRLHYRLGKNHGIYCELYGRTYFVNVLGGGKSGSDKLDDLYEEFGTGLKATSGMMIFGGETRKRAFSKIRFYWDKGGNQVRDWFTYKK